MIDGILLINKKKGMTSYDVVRELKRILPKRQKIGHAGTLDPFATGLLIILLGKGTKLMERMHTLNKEYIVEAEFGYATDTQDVTGEIVDRCKDSKKIPREKIDEIVKSKLLGRQMQVPPAYSAKKIDGQKAYDLARKGIDVKLEEKEIEVKIFEIVEYLWPKISFRILCGTGTYIRTLINDLGEELGCYATAVELKRISIGNYNLNSAFESSNLKEKDIIDNVITLDNI